MRRFLLHRSPGRWLVVLAALSSLAVTIAGVVPHGDDDQHCLVCKVGQQPLQEARATAAVHSPSLRAIRAIIHESTELPSFTADSSSPRAPPELS